MVGYIKNLNNFGTIKIKLKVLLKMIRQYNVQTYFTLKF